MTMHENNRIASCFWTLRLGLGATAFLAGADKFTNLLTDWEKYIAPEASEKLPISNKSFMCIAGNLVLKKDYDIAVRDLNMALGAFVLGQLTALRTRQHGVNEEFVVDRQIAA